MNIRKNLPLVVGIGIPVLMIIFVALSIYLPQIWAQQPQHDFIYSTGDHYSGKYTYYVEGSKIMRMENVQPEDGFIKPIPAQMNVLEPKLYYYSVANNLSREISYEEALGYSINSNGQSPDGFEIVTGNSGGGIFPFYYDGGDYNSRYIKGHNTSKKLNLQSRSQDYYYDFRFLGWVNQ